MPGQKRCKRTGRFMKGRRQGGDDEPAFVRQWGKSYGPDSEYWNPFDGYSLTLQVSAPTKLKKLQSAIGDIYLPERLTMYGTKDDERSRLTELTASRILGTGNHGFAVKYDDTKNGVSYAFKLDYKMGFYDQPGNMDPVSLPQGWVRLLHPENTEIAYYLHPKTGVSQFENPTTHEKKVEGEWQIAPVSEPGGDARYFRLRQWRTKRSGRIMLYYHVQGNIDRKYDKAAAGDDYAPRMSAPFTGEEAQKWNETKTLRGREEALAGHTTRCPARDASRRLMAATMKTGCGQISAVPVTAFELVGEVPKDPFKADFKAFQYGSDDTYTSTFISYPEQKKVFWSLISLGIQTMEEPYEVWNALPEERKIMHILDAVESIRRQVVCLQEKTGLWYTDLSLANILHFTDGVRLSDLGSLYDRKSKGGPTLSIDCTPPSRRAYIDEAWEKHGKGRFGTAAAAAEMEVHWKKQAMLIPEHLIPDASPVADTVWQLCISYQLGMILYQLMDNYGFLPDNLPGTFEAYNLYLKRLLGKYDTKKRFNHQRLATMFVMEPSTRFNIFTGTLLRRS